MDTGLRVITEIAHFEDFARISRASQRQLQCTPRGADPYHLGRVFRQKAPGDPALILIVDPYAVTFAFA